MRDTWYPNDHHPSAAAGAVAGQRCHSGYSGTRHSAKSTAVGITAIITNTLAANIALLPAISWHYYCLIPACYHLISTQYMCNILQRVGIQYTIYNIHIHFTQISSTHVCYFTKQNEGPLHGTGIIRVWLKEGGKSERLIMKTLAVCTHRVIYTNR